jgi:hypothetical protein
MHNTSHTIIKQLKCSESEILLQIEFRIRLQSFEQKIKNKKDLQKRSLIDQERHLALEVSTSEMAHARRERERERERERNTPAVTEPPRGGSVVRIT